MRISKAKKQGKLMQIFSAPIKILSKARDFYVKGMENCANRVSYGPSVGCPSAPAVRLPKSFSVSSFNTAYDDEEFRQLLRAASKKEGRQTAFQMPRSYSVSVGKIGRIEEDEPCAFEEDGVRASLLYPRSTTSKFVNRI
ncbi:3-isopropylmalate dehydratase large subunit like [Melia azedarach]|uniref:3-isopropylmalate dehydratase large subunit like n=1 Tax=Melia azedarach TaxID=155640 RepID=A0ACC1XYV6_MELAZ|nr:3-isopropylmalate dehydratase large subunit like [Melia azedarach]